jgi:glycosyltransferase involved in cell wall biosynthesis
MQHAPASFAPSPAHRLWRLLPPVRRRRALTYVTARLAPGPDRTPPPASRGLAVGGELSRASGLGEGARLMLRGAARLGLPTWPVDLGAPGINRTAEIPPLTADPPQAPPPGVPLVLHINAPLIPLAMLRLGHNLRCGRQIIGYWAWELPVVPPDWYAGLKFVHQLWAPSSFTAAALAPLFPGAVRVVRPPLAVLPPTPLRLDRAAFGLPSNAVVILVAFNLASSFVRKNPLAAIAAFRAAFGTRADRFLLLKVGDPTHFPDDFATLRAAIAGAPNIRIETRVLPPDDRTALMNTADIVLTLHRSEGLGLVAAEAMLLGKPVIATGWSGNLDFMDDVSAALVPARLIPPRDPRGVLQVAGTVWADPDIGVATAHLRRLADDPTARTTLGARGRRMAQARFGLDTLADALRDIGLPVGDLPMGGLPPP